MRSYNTHQKPSISDFYASSRKLADQFGWSTRKMKHDNEVVLIGLIDGDPNFYRFVWIYNVDRVDLRCLLVGKEVVPIERQTAVLELCARVNEGLPFGCLEFSFQDHVLVFRDSASLEWGFLDAVIAGTTARVLNLGQRYGRAIQSVLDGEKPEDAVKTAESD